jgi:predicted nucleic acid-binding protein
MNRAFIDTNIIFENIIYKDFQPKFLKIFQKYKILIHESVLLELGNLLKKVYGSREAGIIIQDLVENFEIYPQNLNDLKYALKIMGKYDFFKLKKDNTLTDAILLNCTENEAWTLISMDQEMSFFKFERGEFVLVEC